MEKRRGLLFALALIQGMGLALLAWVVSVAEARDNGGILNLTQFKQDLEVREMVGRLNCKVAETNTGEACKLSLVTESAPTGIALPNHAGLYEKFHNGETHVRMIARFAGKQIYSISKIESIQ